jgi:FtsP/CotA-like multicopper oxidase with cupredoxin domain
MSTKRLSRRDFLRLSGLGAAALLIPGMAAQDTLTTHLEPALVKASAPAQAAGSLLELDLHAAVTQAQLLPGSKTALLSYQPKLLKGDPGSVVSLPDNYLGPIIRVRKGQHLKINFTNDLSEPTTIHAHGPCIPSHMGGHPHGPDLVLPGGKFVYEYDILDGAAPYWFHPHPHMRVGIQVYYGLAGLMLVTDDVEAKAGLDSGEHDLPLVIQDRLIDADNQFIFESGPMMGGMMAGFMGNRILVNGKPENVLTVQPGAYRLRLYNGSNARTYKLAWQNGADLTVIGTDGGLLPKPVQRKYLMLGAGERLDLWVDFSDLPEGSQMVMQSLPFQFGMGMMGGGMGMMGGMSGVAQGRRVTGPSILPLGANFTVFKLLIQGAKKPAFSLPPDLAGAAPYRLQDAVNAAAPRTIYLGMRSMMNFTLNGRVFEMDAVADDEKIPLEKLEVWDFVNQTMVAHPMHIHNVQFNVIGRQWPMTGVAGDQTSQGFVDDGWKDTVLVRPGERVRLLVKFNSYQGMYMYHCHILDHEDMGMMRNLMVGDSMGM